MGKTDKSKISAKIIGENVRRYRLKVGMTIQELAESR